MSSELARPAASAISAQVIESIVLRGDLSGLGPRERAAFYIRMCEGLGLNPNSQPFAFLRLNGKEVLYATRGATDQLAAMHGITRETIDGPKVIDLAGTKLVFCVVRATHPSGRVETATATVPLVDPVNVLMKCETKAKRRATLSILGLGMLDEMELETIPANVQEPGGGVDLSQAPRRADVTVEPPRAEVPPALEGLYARIAQIELPGESVAVWMRYRTDLASMPAPDREEAWKALCKRTEEVGKMKNAKVWLKKAIAEEDACRGNESGHAPITDAEVDEPEADPEAEPKPEPEVEGPSSHAFNTFVEELPKARSLADVHTAYNTLVDGLNEEGADLQHWTQGDDGAGKMAHTRMIALGAKLAVAERDQVLRSRPLAELLDMQSSIGPSADALKVAAQWWIANKPRVNALEEQAHRKTPWYSLVRRYSGASQAAETKKASAALEGAVKLLDKPPPPSPTGNDGPARGGPTMGAAARSATSASSSKSGARACLDEWAAHINAKPRSGDDHGAAAVAGSFAKHRAKLRTQGIHAEALAVTLDEIASRGIAEPHAYLDTIAEKNGYVQRPAKAA